MGHSQVQGIVVLPADFAVGVDADHGVDTFGGYYHIMKIAFFKDPQILTKFFHHDVDHVIVSIAGDSGQLRSPHLFVLTFDDGAFVYTDSNRDFSILAGGDYFAYLLSVLDVAGVEADFVNAGFDRFHSTSEMKMNISNNRYW